MRNTRIALAAAASAASLALPAAAQTPAEGFAVERLVLSAPGSAWFALDDLAWPGGIGGALSLSLGYASRPLAIQPAGGGPALAVVEHQAFADVGLAVAADRFRLSAHFASPFYVAGRGGTVDGFAFSPPAANLEQTPDVLSDVQLGLETRLVGDPGSALRVGAEGVLWFPSGARNDYLSDGSYRTAASLLLAGDAGGLSYAARAGAHVRALDQSPAPGGPRGSELLLGAAIGSRLPLPRARLIVGPELTLASAFRSLFGGRTTALEALLTARLDMDHGPAARLGLRLGIGAGLHPDFGAPRWRAVVAVDLAGILSRGPDRGAAATSDVVGR